MFIWLSIILLVSLMLLGFFLLYLQWSHGGLRSGEQRRYTIFVHNSAAEIEGVIRALFRRASLHGVDIRLEVVDFSSEDDTFLVVERLARYYQLHYYTAEEWEQRVSSWTHEPMAEQRIEVIDLRHSS